MNNLLRLFLLLSSSMYGVLKGEPNFILIITDDQDLLLDGMIPMKKTVELIANNGKTFQNAYVNTPICCPSRSTILTGKYLENTGVVNNSISGNCSSLAWQQTHEPHSIAALLKSAKNYTTYYSGKYLNQYGTKEAGGVKHIPVGYDWWIGLQGNSKYYNYTLSVNGTGHFFSNKYLTDALAGYSLSFLTNKPNDKPVFMIVAPPAPHAPFTPAKRHENAFAGTKAVRTPSFNHSGYDKHWLVRMYPQHLPENVEILDSIQQHRLESLLAVDELVDRIVQKLKVLNIFQETYIIYTSDNGFHIGQFSQPWDKRQPYETDVRVPFIVSGPNVPRKTLETFPISSVDIAPTILDLAGVNIPSSINGKSFKKELLSEKTEPFVKFISISYKGEANQNSIDKSCPWTYDPNLSECTLDQWCKCQDSRNNTYQCFIYFSGETKFKGCSFNDAENFTEAYDLKADPFELKNLCPELNSCKYEHKLKVGRFLKCSGKSC
ncbi:N-acetylglucosamine-6-sulfatase-like [Diabrotica undecimpunctata]|uniref:N-acetylglucosamine-6-sulfatase-like n=1 Tax=Diabrotica undecimpunctata TaxID=50387 RepID=UPI003B6351AA